jgi:hypothetical protein
LKILIGADVDPILPAILSKPASSDIWTPIDLIPTLIDSMGEDLPKITWLIRSDESVRFSTGEFASGFLSRRRLWQGLAARGHELGWHMHLLTIRDGVGRFDPDPAWLRAAFEGLAKFYPVRSVRTGWDYGSNILFRRFKELGVAIDFSALPGNIGWQKAGPDMISVDWRFCPEAPYQPHPENYQRPCSNGGSLWEVPITQFRGTAAEASKRLLWRSIHGSLSWVGIKNKTRLLTQFWNQLPHPVANVCAFFFHPEELTPAGIENFVRNVHALRGSFGGEFVTASEFVGHNFRSPALS